MEHLVFFTILCVIYCLMTVCHSHENEIECDACYDHEAIKVRKVNETLNTFVDRLFYEYHSLNRPVNLLDPSQPTLVYVNIFINSFGHISVHDMDFSVDIFLRQKWNEPRLRFDGYDANHISLGYYKNKMWTPDLFFRNSKKSEFHRVTKPNYLIFLYKNGDILFSQKVSLTISCPMKLALFPMDSQTCGIEIGSYGYALSELNFTWMSPGKHDDNVQLNDDVNLNEFLLPKVDTFSCVKEYKTTGGFACIRVNFKLHRRFKFYLIYIFLPSTLIVGISWLSFFIDFSIVPARITLGLLSMLTLMTQCTATIQNQPNVSYLRAIDVWLFTCLAFVASTLIEFAVVSAMCTEEDQDISNGSNSYNRKTSSTVGRGSREVSPKEHQLATDDTNPDFDEGFFKPPKRFRFSKTIGHRVDRIFLIAFPTGFVLFNIIYWIVYENVEN